MSTQLPTIRQALKAAREACRRAKRHGSILTIERALSDGRTLLVTPAEAAESHPGNRCYLFGVWVYTVYHSPTEHGRYRALKLED
jgi:hypothetical protein